MYLHCHVFPLREMNCENKPSPAANILQKANRTSSRVTNTKEYERRVLIPFGFGVIREKLRKYFDLFKEIRGMTTTFA